MIFRRNSLAPWFVLFVLTLTLSSSFLPLYAGAPQSAEAVQFFYKAVAAYDREDFGGAKTNLQLALERDSNFAEAYILKGLLAYHDGKADDANANFQKALQLNPRLPDKVRDRLEKQAHDIESGLTEQEFSHFRLQFHGADQRDKAWNAVKWLDDVYNEMGSRFSLFPTEKIQVIIFSSQEFWEAWNAPMWLGGFFDKRDGKVRVRIDDPPGGQEEYRRRVRHEFTHAFIHHIYGKDLPMWFQEGSAQFYGYFNPTNSFWKETRLQELSKLMKGAPWMTMDQVQEAILKKNVSPGYIYLAYLESEALCLYIAKQRGESWIPSVISRLNQGMNFDQAFKEVIGLSPSEMMEKMRQSLS